MTGSEQVIDRPAASKPQACDVQVSREDGRVELWVLVADGHAALLSLPRRQWATLAALLAAVSTDGPDECELRLTGAILTTETDSR